MAKAAAKTVVKAAKKAPVADSTLTLKEMIAVFVDFRHEVVVRRTRFELKKAQARAHILEGLLKAIDIIDEIIATIRASRTPDTAKSALIEKYGTQ